MQNANIQNFSLSAQELNKLKRNLEKYNKKDFPIDVVIIGGTGRVGSRCLKEMLEDSELRKFLNPIAVISLSGDRTKSINAVYLCNTKAEKLDSTTTKINSKDFVPAVSHIEDIPITSKSGMVLCLDLSSPDGTKRAISELNKFAKNHPNKKIFLDAITNDQNGSTQKIYDDLVNGGQKAENFKFSRTDNVNGIKDFFEKNYKIAEEMGAELVFTDIHRKEKEPVAGVLNNFTKGKEWKGEKGKTDLVRTEIESYYDITKQSPEDRKIEPIKVLENISISSVRTESQDTLQNQGTVSTFIADVMVKDRNKKVQILSNTYTIDDERVFVNKLLRFAMKELGKEGAIVKQGSYGVLK